jgi:hypothetical protein
MDGIGPLANVLFASSHDAKPGIHRREFPGQKIPDREKHILEA